MIFLSPLLGCLHRMEKSCVFLGVIFDDVVDIWMNVEKWCNHTDKGNSKHQERSLSQCHFVRTATLTGLRPNLSLPSDRPAINRLNPGRTAHALLYQRNGSWLLEKLTLTRPNTKFFETYDNRNINTVTTTINQCPLPFGHWMPSTASKTYLLILKYEIKHMRVSQLSQLNVCTSHVCRMSYQNKNVTNTVVENTTGKTQTSLHEGHGIWEVRYRKGNNSRIGPVIPKILLCRKTRKGLSGTINDFCLLRSRSKNRVTLADNI